MKLRRLLGSIPLLKPLCYKVERGWDPVSSEYSAKYSEGEWRLSETIARRCDDIERRLGGIAGKRVLDLGGGPGQYAVAFAERGAHVTWHDPSRNYMLIAQQKAVEKGVSCQWSLGYLEDARRLQRGTYDMLFNRICWYYCISDRRLVELVIQLLKPGGSAWLDIPTVEWARSHKAYARWFTRAKFLIYSCSGLKLSYFMPKRGKVLKLCARNPRVEHIEVDYSDPDYERIWLSTYS